MSPLHLPRRERLPSPTPPQTTAVTSRPSGRRNVFPGSEGALRRGGCGVPCFPRQLAEGLASPPFPPLRQGVAARLPRRGPNWPCLHRWGGVLFARPLALHGNCGRYRGLDPGADEGRRTVPGPSDGFGLALSGAPRARAGPVRLGAGAATS